jgi:ABC-type Fe3+/spermidine/putrescine transport system ATPase subunit
MLLSLQNVSKAFGSKLALDHINLDIAHGEIVCLLVPSGCGKTTLLRIVAGLETVDTGQLLCEGQDLTPIPPHRRDFGLMFQDYALFPHKNVFENVAFGLTFRGGGWRMRRLDVVRGDEEIGDSDLPSKIQNPKSKIENRKSTKGTQNEIQNRVEEMLALVGLEGFEGRSVNDLSGGEAQRVALARSLAPRPRLLMLDEPLGSLDRALRERLMLDLRDILKGVDVTALYVTHDQAEAFAIADRVVVMLFRSTDRAGPLLLVGGGANRDDLEGLPRLARERSAAESHRGGDAHDNCQIVSSHLVTIRRARREGFKS